MKKILLVALTTLSIGAFAQNENVTKKDKDLTLSVLYVINTTGNTMSGGSVVLSSKDFTILAMLERKSDNSQAYYTTKIAVYNLGVGHRIAHLGNFQTRAFIGIGTIRTTTTAPATIYNTSTSNDDFKANISFGLVGEGKFMSYLAGVESNYTGAGLVLGIGINSGILK